MRPSPVVRRFLAFAMRPFGGIFSSFHTGGSQRMEIPNNDPYVSCLHFSRIMSNPRPRGFFLSLYMQPVLGRRGSAGSPA